MKYNEKFNIGFINCDELGKWTGELSIYTANMAKLYRNNGHKVHLFVKNNLPIPNNLKGVYIHFVKSPKRVGLITLFKYRFNSKVALRDLYKKALLEEVKKIVDKGYIDILDIPEKSGLAESLFKLNIPKTVSLHYGEHLEYVYPGFKHTTFTSMVELDEKKILSNGDSYISATKHITDLYRHNNSINHIESLHYLNYPLENKFYQNIDPIPVEGELNILISTRYSKRKRLEPLLEMITKSILTRDYEQKIIFNFVGLEDKQFLNLLKANPFYKKNIFYKNYVVRPKFKDEYAKSDIVVIPTSSESFSYTLIESLFAKKLVIVASDSGNDEFVENGITGFVFENDNFEHLAKILDSIISKPKLRNFISNNSEEKINSTFNYNQIYKLSRDAYIDAFNNRE